MGNVVVYHQTDVIDINTSRNDICGYQDIDTSCLELIHHFFALCLLQVGVHFTNVQFHLLQSFGHFLHFQFGRSKDDNAFRRLLCKEATDDAQLLILVADVGCLHNLFCRFGNSQLHLGRIVQNVTSQLLYLSRHGGREHDCLPLFRKEFDNLHNIVIKSHIQHPVCFIQNKIRDTGKIYITKAKMGYQTPRGSNNDISTQCQPSFLLLEQYSVITAIHSHAGNRHEIRETFHLLVYLLRQLAGRSHDNAIDGIGRVSAL